MKNVKTKSILIKKSGKDGLRICVMRRIRPEYEFDLWIPGIAPSENLLEKYVIKKTIGWDKFAKKYSKETLDKREDLLTVIIEAAKKQPITLLCGEKSARYCHRRLIIERCTDMIKKSKKTAK